MGWVAGIDIGGTNIKCGRMEDDRLVEAFVSPVPDSARDADGMVQTLSGLVRQLAESPPDAVGIGVAGVVDRAGGIVTTSPNFPLWRDFPIGQALQRAISCPVTVDNDANAVIWGEVAFGVARGARNLVGLTLGTGVGGAIVLEGALWRGERGMAGELGHMTVDPGGPRCNCGNHGCLECYASASGIAHHLAQSKLCYGEGTELMVQLAGLARGGDECALALFTRVGWALGVALAGLLNALDVRLVVLCGGITATSDLFSAAMWQEIRTRAFGPIVAGLEVREGILGPQAGIVGAAALALSAAGRASVV